MLRPVPRTSNFAQLHTVHAPPAFVAGFRIVFGATPFFGKPAILVL
jgi:hypothetical protein